MITRFLFAILVLSSFSAASAQIVKSDPTTYICSALPGKFEALNLALVGDHFSSRVTFQEVREHAKWAPLAGLLFVLPGNKRYAGVHIVAYPHEPGLLTVAVNTPSSQSVPTALVRVPRGEPVVVETILDKRGRLTVSAAGRSKTLRIKKATKTARRISCSTAAVKFEDILVAELEK